MSRSFRDDYGVFVCDHILKQTAPVLFSVRDWDGTWQFLCGGNLLDDKIHLVHVGEMLTREPELAVLAELEPGTFAERSSSVDKWEIGRLPPDEPDGVGV